MTYVNRRTCLMSLAALLGGASATVARADPLSAVSDAKIVGKGRYTYLGLSLFDATLYAPSGKFDPGKTFALRLDYLKSFGAGRIIDNTLKEIRKQGFTDAAKLAEWERQMTEIFPDISHGSHITGVRDQAGHAVFYHNGKSIGAIRDTQFSRYFFNIWLGASAPSTLRNKLLGKG